MSKVLEGIRVLELAYHHVGPMAGSMLADLGAEVIKVEDTQGGDVARGFEFIAGIPMMTPKGSAGWVGANRGKKDIAIDLKKPEGREVVYRLLPKVDVFLSAHRRPALRKLGMDYETVARYAPRIVYAHASAYGDQGPDADLPGTDFAGQARAGILLTQREPDDEPWAVAGLGDQMGAISTAYCILAALLARERLGIGQEVETSILGGMVWLETLLLNVTLLIGRELGPHRREDARNPLLNTYRASDGKWICLSMGTMADAWWPRFCQAIERPDLEQDPRFHNMEARSENNKEMIALLEELFRQRPRAEWMERLNQYDCQASPLNGLRDLASDPQVMANQYVVEHDDPVLGKQKAIGFPGLLKNTPMEIASPAPRYAEHTEEVLLGLGEYTREEIAQLRDAQIIV